MSVPVNLKYTKDHEWIRVEADHAYVGITAFAAGELGDIVYVDISCEGDDLDAGEVFGTVEAVKTVSDLFMPVSGKVLEVNPGLESDPESVNSDPYGKGWMIKVEIKDRAELADLLGAEEYEKIIH